MSGENGGTLAAPVAELIRLQRCGGPDRTRERPARPRGLPLGRRPGEGMAPSGHARSGDSTTPIRRRTNAVGSSRTGEISKGAAISRKGTVPWHVCAAGHLPERSNRTFVMLVIIVLLMFVATTLAFAVPVDGVPATIITGILFCIWFLWRLAEFLFRPRPDETDEDVGPKDA